MNILAIESSCDDTSVAYLSGSFKEPIIIHAQKTASQIDVHKAFGGVVPEVAGRKHAEAITPLIEEILKDKKKPDYIAITSGPGLMTGLMVGIEAAKTLSYSLDISLLHINHLEGHIHSAFLPTQEVTKPALNTLQFPALSLLVSGGHTEIILMKSFGEYERLGKTLDDAAGEAFDKVGKMVKLEYPGGPKVSKLALEGDAKAINFPRPMMTHDSLDFSFSGLKTAVLYYLQDNPDYNINDVCASAQQAIIDVLVAKVKKAIKLYNPKSLILGGGVSANDLLRTSLQNISDDITFYIPEKSYSMDNAAMIGAAAIHHAEKEQTIDWRDLQANPNWKIDKA